MNTQIISQIKTQFSTCNTINELKSLYKKLCNMYHPDNGGDEEVMKFVNNQYECLFNKFKNEYNWQADNDSTGKTRHMNECSDEFINIINKIINLKNINIELCGSWIWVSGETRQYIKIFHELTFRWASNKKMWYWRNEKDAVKNNKSKSMEYIREKYGSEKFTNNKSELTV